jgi:photosystem II stability/assembly factor-like uncharacterized protein
MATQPGVAAPARIQITPYSGFFWTPHDGLLGVEVCASTKYMCGTGAVELTTDGGRTYRVIFRTPRPVVELDAIGRDGALARVYDASTYSGTLGYRTLDRGGHWTKLWMRPRVSFATPRIGLGYGELGPLHTRDGGRTWQRLPNHADCLGAQPIFDLVTPQLGWMLCGGEPGAGQQQKEVFRTRDGGHTWQAGAWAIAGRHPESRGGLGFGGYVAGMAFARDGFGLVWADRGTLLVTRDGGMTWKGRLRFARPDVDWGLGGSAFGNGTALLLFQHNELEGPQAVRLIETRDFGRSWHIVRTWRD